MDFKHALEVVTRRLSHKSDVVYESHVMTLNFFSQVYVSNEFWRNKCEGHQILIIHSIQQIVILLFIV